MYIKYVDYKDIDTLPEDWLQNTPLDDILHFSIGKGSKQYGTVSLLNIDGVQCLGQLYVKPRYRGRALTRAFWKSIYNLVFNALNFKVFVAETVNPLMSSILLRERWVKSKDNFYYITIDKVRHIK